MSAPESAPAAPGPGSSAPQADAYRPALDGIRALAVLGVIGYHVGWLRGGFLGVDMFFVLSGYLITTLLLREFEASSRISLPRFWARRARRLYPAVLLLILAFVVELWRIQSELGVLHERREDIVSTLFYYANWHFIATDQSYFATFLTASPLRHTWSLAIEEQFYVLWPLLVLAALRLGRFVRVPLLAMLVAAGTLGSAFAIGLLYDPQSASRAYFGTDARAHELLVGAGLALLLARSSRRDADARLRRWRWAAVLGAGVVLVAFGTLGDQERLYYDGGSLLFSLAVAAVIAFVELRPASRAARTLAVPPMAWVGRISYSLYLWHWPLIIWTTSFVTLSSDRLLKPLAIALTFVMASASYYIVERPIRYGRIPWLRLSHPRLAIVLAAAVAVAFGGAYYVTSGRAADSSAIPCPPGSPSVAGLRWCVRVDPSAADPPVVATVGDSTARALDPGFQQIAVTRAWRFIDAGQNGCSLLPLQFEHEFNTNCPQTVRRLVATIAATYHPDVWFVSDVFAVRPVRGASGELIPIGDPRRAALLERSLHRMLTLLTADGARVVLVAPPPVGAPPQCGTRVTGTLCGDAQFSVHDAATLEIAGILRRAAAALPGRVAYVSVVDVLCNAAGRCPAVIGGRLARVDGVHYTATFSRRIAPMIVARAARAGVRVAHG